MEEQQNITEVMPPPSQRKRFDLVFLFHSERAPDPISFLSFCSRRHDLAAADRVRFPTPPRALLLRLPPNPCTHLNLAGLATTPCIGPAPPSPRLRPHDRPVSSSCSRRRPPSGKQQRLRPSTSSSSSWRLEQHLPHRLESTFIAGRPKENGLSAQLNRGAVPNVTSSVPDAEVAARSGIEGVLRSRTVSEHALSH